MANSNVSSAAYRAASGWKSWGRVKGGNNYIIVDGPKPAHVEKQLDILRNREDSYHLQKEKLRDTLSEGYDESLVTVVKEGKRAACKEKKKKVLTARRKKVTIKPSKKLNRKEKRALKFSNK